MMPSRRALSVGMNVLEGGDDLPHPPPHAVMGQSIHPIEELPFSSKYLID